MAVSVAPLTTVVMESVDQDRVGTASGINNAIARVAGLLAVAVLGVVMVSQFSAHLNRQLANLDVPQQVRTHLQQNETRLAALAPPGNLDPRSMAQIKAAIASSFVFSFRLIILICAGLALASAAVAGSMIPANQSLQPKASREAA